MGGSVVIDFIYPPGATPIDPDEAAGLVPRHISTQSELNAWEEANIVTADGWAFRQTKRELLDEGFVRDLHRKMFDETWRWAGTFRSSNKNIGVDWNQISTRLHDLLENTRYQIAHPVFPRDELAVRFHHQLVLVHAFPNGNGRHSRLMADALVTHLGGARFTWGQNSLVTAGAPRDQYLNALRVADQGNPESLIQFARA
jgi:Fic-DOC domain mobile mystery protein B